MERQKILREIQNCNEPKENENTAYQKFWDTVK